MRPLLRIQCGNRLGGGFDMSRQRHINMQWMPKRADLERILIVAAAGLVVVLAVHGGESTPVTETMWQEPVVETAPTAAEPAAETQSTICWYCDGDGYLVPVTRQVPKQDGIAKATLNLMTASSENDLAAARMGLTTVIPEGTTFDLDISGGKARVDFSKQALSCANAEQELLMVQATAAALCCFDTVDEVSFLFDGQKRSQLTHGTDVSGVFTANSVNVESITTLAASDYADQLQLYFPSASGRALVPITRTVFSTADLPTAMLELAKGPRADSGLERPLPANCGINSVTLKNGVASIDFTKDFLTVLQSADEGQQSLRAILFTASQFPGVKKLTLTVDGSPVTIPPATQTTFLNDAATLMTQYPGIVELD